MGGTKNRQQDCRLDLVLKIKNPWPLKFFHFNNRGFENFQ